MLFLQATEPAGYPPLIHASCLMADAGWEVTFLSAPIAGMTLILNPHPRISVYAIASRPSHVIRKAAYARYLASAAALALRVRPDVVYASDPLGAAPGTCSPHGLRARTSSITSTTALRRVPYSPGSRAYVPRRCALRGLSSSQTKSAHGLRKPSSVLPLVACALSGTYRAGPSCRSSCPSRSRRSSSIIMAASRLNVCPKSVIEAVQRYHGRVRLRIAGYEAPGAQVISHGLWHLPARQSGEPLVEYVGPIPRRSDLLAKPRALMSDSR